MRENVHECVMLSIMSQHQICEVGLSGSHLEGDGVDQKEGLGMLGQVALETR